MDGGTIYHDKGTRKLTGFAGEKRVWYRTQNNAHGLGYVKYV